MRASISASSMSHGPLTKRSHPTNPRLLKVAGRSFATGMCDASSSSVPEFVPLERPIKPYVRCRIANAQFTLGKTIISDLIERWRDHCMGGGSTIKAVC